jgi:hypothetical protein
MAYIDPGSRGQANLLINEMLVNKGWVEIYDTANSGSATSLTNPSQIGITISHTANTGGAVTVVAIRDFAGSTTTAGFATIDYDITKSVNGAGGLTYHVALWCSACGSGSSNQTLDNVTVPTANGMWGRYPDGSSTWTTTLSTTKGSANAIPELSDLGAPLLAGALFLVFHSRGRSSRRRQGLAAKAQAPERHAPARSSRG